MIKTRKNIVILAFSLVIISGLFLFWKLQKKDKISNQNSNGAKITQEQRNKLVFGVVKTTNFTKKNYYIGL